MVTPLVATPVVGAQNGTADVARVLHRRATGLTSSPRTSVSVGALQPEVRLASAIERICSGHEQDPSSPISPRLPREFRPHGSCARDLYARWRPGGADFAAVDGKGRTGDPLRTPEMGAVSPRREGWPPRQGTGVVSVRSARLRRRSICDSRPVTAWSAAGTPRQPNSAWRP